MAYAAKATKDDGKKKRRGRLFSHDARLNMVRAHDTQQRNNRKEAELDGAYYDGDQLTEDERKELADRGQPITIHNLLAKKLNTLIGEQIEKRVDKNAKPRTPKHENDARAATALIRFAADEAKAQSVLTDVAEGCWKYGIGAALKTYENGKHVQREVPYDRFGYDIHSRHRIFKDARAVWAITWLYKDVALEKFGDECEHLFESDDDDTDTTRDEPSDWMDFADQENPRVKVIEMYFRDGDDWYCAYFTRAGDFCEPEKTWLKDEEGKHSVCPLLAVSCYIKKNGDRYGILRNLRSIQDAINKRESKSLHLLNAEQVIAEKGVIAQPEAFMAELAKPDGFAEVAAGALVDPITGRERIQIRRHLDLATGHVQLLQEAKASLDRQGPSAANLPDIPAGASGRAIIQRRKANSLDYGRIFDSLTEFAYEMTLLDWYTTRQEYNEERAFRISDETDGYRWVTINRNITRAKFFRELVDQKPPVPPQQALETATDVNTAPMVMFGAQQAVPMLAQRAQAMGQQVPPDQLLVQAIEQHPLMREMVSVNKVAEMMIDIVISDAPDTSVIAEEEFATLVELMPAVLQAKPDLAQKMAELVVQASTLPDKRDLLEKLKSGPSPQQQQQQQQIQQLQQQLAATEMQLKAAQVGKTTAETELTKAKTQTELQQLSLPMQPQQPDPLQHAKAQREQVGTQLDVERTRAEVEESRTRSAKNMADAAARTRKANEPPREVPR